MKLTIERAALLRALGHVQSVVERRTTIPILANVLLRADGERLTLTATDMDLEICDAAAAEIAQEGALTAPAHTLYEIVRKLPEGGQVALDSATDPSFLTLSAGRSRFRLGMLPVEDYPRMGDGAETVSFTLPAHRLRETIDRTRFAVSTEETRYYLNGIHLHATSTSEGELMRAVATDGHRLAQVQLALPEGAAGMPAVIVPRKAVAELRKLIEDGPEEVTLGLSETKIRVEIGEIVLTSKLIDGTFPDYERVIPSGNNKTLEVDPKSFAGAVDRVATISTEKTRAVKLALEPGHLTLSASSPDAGSASEELEVAYDADPMEIGFNARYLLDIMNQIEGEACHFALADSASPSLIRDSAGIDALFVLMPMRV